MPIIIRGRIIHGRGLGSKLGYPTANLEAKGKIDNIPDGVYASRMRFENSAHQYQGVTSVGVASTVGAKERTIETYLFDFNGKLYGERVILELMAYLRPMRTFSSLEKLKQVIGKDIVKAKQCLQALLVKKGL